MNKSLNGKEIKQIRNTLGLTQRAFAVVLGISYPYLSDVERGKKVPSRQLVNLILTKRKSTEAPAPSDQVTLRDILKLYEAIEKLGAEIGSIKDRMLDAAQSGDIHRLGAVGGKGR